MATFSVNAATVTSIGPAQPGDTIEWTNGTSNGIPIAVSAVNGVFPLDGPNSFTVPAGMTITCTVAPNAPSNTYLFARNGVAGAGHIKVGQGK